MKFEPIITHMTDIDLYKYTMFQAVYNREDHQHRPLKGYTTRFDYKNRGEFREINKEASVEVAEQIEALRCLRYTSQELKFLGNITWIKDTTIEFLKHFWLDPDMVTVDWNEETGLSVSVSGPWIYVIWWEIYVLAIVSEVRSRMCIDYPEMLADHKHNTDLKLERIGIHGDLCIGDFSEFGTRRRLSFEAQEYVIEKLANMKFSCSNFVGTSNVYFAMKYNLTPVGTMAHEWIMGTGQGSEINNPALSNWIAMDLWYQEYGTWNGIVLPDTLGLDVFLLDFNRTFATTFSGVRHDSGDPYEFGEKLIAHYKKLGFDDAFIKTRTLLFSDGLDFETADALFRYFNGRIKVAFGIGTYLTNDSYYGPLNAVMKMTECNGLPVCKLSDTPGKTMCPDEEHIADVRHDVDKRLRRAAAREAVKNQVA